MTDVVEQTLDEDVLGGSAFPSDDDLDNAVPSPLWVNSQPVTRIRIADLVLDGSPRREGEDWDHIRVLAELGDAVPPIMVHRPTMRVIDGVHRVQAAMLNGQALIAARLVDCDANAAFVLAVRANVAHGLPLSQPDRLAAASRIISANPHWSDRAVAAATGLSDKTVSRVRGRTADPAARGEVRLGRDGRLRPVDSGDRRRRAAAMISENPGLGLRTVARATGLSPATVQDVRQRMARGEDPVPERYRAPAPAPAPVAEPPPQTSAGNHALRTDGSVDQDVLLAKLRNDPALRFSEAGRHLLRWLHRYTVDAEAMERLSTDMPEHCAPVIADLALSCASAWSALAERLRDRID